MRLYERFTITKIQDYGKSLTVGSKAVYGAAWQPMVTGPAGRSVVHNHCGNKGS